MDSVRPPHASKGISTWPKQALVPPTSARRRSAEIAMSLANLKARQEKPDEMLPFLKDVIRHANNLGMRRWAAET